MNTEKDVEDFIKKMKSELDQEIAIFLIRKLFEKCLDDVKNGVPKENILKAFDESIDKLLKE